MKKGALKILIVDDHEMLLEGLQNFVQRTLPNATILLAKNYKEIISVFGARQLDVLLLDLFLGKEDARNFIDQLLHLQPNLHIIVVSSLEDEKVICALFQNGVKGFVGKSSPTSFITQAIQTVLEGKNYLDPAIEERMSRQKGRDVSQIVLTAREKEVLRETMEGKKIKEIASCLCISQKTVENHRSNLFVKFDVNNATGLVNKAILLGFANNLG